MTVNRLLAVILACFVVGACSEEAGRQTSEATDGEAILARFESVITAYNAQDLDALKAAYTKDAWHISPRRPMVQGQEAIGAYFGPNMGKLTFESNYDVLELSVYGNRAHLLLQSRLKGIPASGVPIPEFVEERVTLTVFERDTEAGWLISGHMETTPPKEDIPTLPSK